MLSATTILSSLTGAAQEKVLMGAAEAIGKVKKEDQLNTLYEYFKGKFTLDQINAVSNVWKNLSNFVKGK